MAKLTIDGKEIEVPDGTRLFDACTEARGEALPHFCYHPDLSIAGVCRLCQVEVEGMPKLTIACNTFVRDGMVVHTRNERVTKASEQILEMHLINHPVDCPICDQAGECGLQDQYMAYGLYDSHVEKTDKVLKSKAKVIGPHVILDQERCVLCSRCVRFCEEVTGTGELGIYNRGDRAEIDVAPGLELGNNYSLNTVDICPVGALTSRDFRFQKRVWMLKSAESVCPGCATGCNVRLDHGAGRIYRLKPRRNPEVNGSWMCDRGRMVYKPVHDERRLTEPMRRSGGEPQAVRWTEIGDELSGLLKPGSVALAVTSAHQSLEEQYLFKRLALSLAGEEQISGGLAGSDLGEGDELLLDADRTPNRRGLELLELAETSAEELVRRLRDARGTILIHGGNPAADPAVAEALGSCDRVIYIGTHQNETAAAAALALPGSMWAEKAGTFVNRQGRLQSFKQAVLPAAAVRDDWRILAEMLAAVESDTDLASLVAVRRALGAGPLADAGIDLNQLPVVGVVPSGSTNGDPQDAGGDH